MLSFKWNIALFTRGSGKVYAIYNISVLVL